MKLTVENVVKLLDNNKPIEFTDSYNYKNITNQTKRYYPTLNTVLIYKR